MSNTPADAVLGSPAGTQTLDAYLPSRTAELVLHALDLARATGQQVTVAETSLAAVLTFVARRVALRPDAVDVLSALTGRGALPDRYSVY